MAVSIGMSTTINNIGVAMFTVADQDAALAFYRDKLGFEVRADVSFGDAGGNRWLEVAPAGSTARLALNPPMNGTPGGGSIGVETPDLDAEHRRLGTVGIVLDPPSDIPGAPRMISLEDPDGNWIWIVETPAE